jgi:hypothetical protein
MHLLIEKIDAQIATFEGQEFFNHSVALAQLM